MVIRNYSEPFWWDLLFPALKSNSRQSSSPTYECRHLTAQELSAAIPVASLTKRGQVVFIAAAPYLLISDLITIISGRLIKKIANSIAYNGG